MLAIVSLYSLKEKKITKFRVIDVPGYGNCLFEAVGRSVGISADNLRTQTVDFMKTTEKLHGIDIRDWIAWNAEAQATSYIEKMSRPGTWGGGIELAIMSTMLRKPIVVFSKEHTGSAKRIAEFLPDECTAHELESTGVIAVLYVGSSHYMQLQWITDE